jgi:acyl-CoA thioesterase FadM
MVCAGQIQYKAELRAGDPVEIRSRILEIGEKKIAYLIAAQ